MSIGIGSGSPLNSVLRDSQSLPDFNIKGNTHLSNQYSTDVRNRKHYTNGSPGKKDQLIQIGSRNLPQYDQDYRRKFNDEAKLLEQDPFMLEEQRYLDRLKLSQLK